MDVINLAALKRLSCLETIASLRRMLISAGIQCLVSLLAHDKVFL